MIRQHFRLRFSAGALIFLATGLGACATSPATTADSLKDLTDYALVYTDGGKATPKSVSISEAADVLKTFDVIFVGEEHRHPGNHLAQMALFRAIQERVPNMSLSMEQFERDVQGVVDNFMAGKIGEQVLRTKGRAWDNYPVSYRPLVEYAKERGLSVIAAEAPGSVIRCVGEKGAAFLATMKPEQREWAAAQLNLNEEEQLRGFDESIVLWLCDFSADQLLASEHVLRCGIWHSRRLLCGAVWGNNSRSEQS